ncbi:MAG: hypothetical protein JSS63_02460 [Bacteroidetes bacterium]|nr:hypothetical protein [Bacteroidota bacterium]MBX7046648.1 hypothetical protein [Ignavibacteria bacterium]
MDKSKPAGKNPAQKIDSATVEDLKEGVGILERIAGIFISIVSIFKSKGK